MTEKVKWVISRWILSIASVIGVLCVVGSLLAFFALIGSNGVVGIAVGAIILYAICLFRYTIFND